MYLNIREIVIENLWMIRFTIMLRNCAHMMITHLMKTENIVKIVLILVLILKNSSILILSHIFMTLFIVLDIAYVWFNFVTALILLWLCYIKNKIKSITVTYLQTCGFSIKCKQSFWVRQNCTFVTGSITETFIITKSLRLKFLYRVLFDF